MVICEGDGIITKSNPRSFYTAAMKCQTNKSDGEQCHGNAMDEGFCYFHNPSIPEGEKRAVQALGGRNNAPVVENPLPAIPIGDAREVADLLGRVINEVRSGGVDPVH